MYDNDQPICDICDQPQDCGRGGCDMHTGDWNGETGCHLSCERGE